MRLYKLFDNHIKHSSLKKCFISLQLFNLEIVSYILIFQFNLKKRKLRLILLLIISCIDYNYLDHEITTKIISCFFVI